MRRMAIWVFAAAIFSAGTGASAQDLTAEDVAGLQKLADGNAAFAIDLYRILGRTDGNVFYSPLSVTAALGMTAAGARGNTAAEMEKTLHFPAKDPTLHARLGLLMRHLGGKTKEKSGYEFAIANRLWGQKGAPFEKDYLALVRDHYGAALDPADFRENAEAERTKINQWVEKQTRDKIKDLFPPGTIRSDTGLVLANAVTFKGDWAVHFNKKLTQEAPFFVAAGDPVKVPLMHQVGVFGYGETPDAQVVELPYKGGDLSMAVVLPMKKDGLPALEKSLTVKTLNALLKAPGRGMDVKLHLPRFKVEFAAGLNDPLCEAGMREAFSARADFSGISPEAWLISKVVHKAFVDVNEEGTEAAAATGVVCGPPSEPPLPAVFRADHPFLFVIRHIKTGAILFMGRLVKP